MWISEILRPLQEILPFTHLINRFESRSGPPAESSVKGMPGLMDKTGSIEECNSEEIISRLQLTNKLQAYNISKYETVLDNLNDGIMILDSSSRIMGVNHIMEQLLNRKREEIKGNHIRDCEGTNDIVTFILENHDSIQKLLEKTGDITVEALNLKVFYKALIRNDGNHCGSIIIAKDVTSQKLADQAKIEFLSHVSHELKAPLNTIKSYMEMLVDGEANSRDAILEFCNTVNEETDRLSGLINNLLHLSKIEMGSLTLSKTMTKTREFMESIFRTATSQTRKDINFELILPDKIPPINIDKEFVGIVLINLIGNAVKYTSENGRVTLMGEEDENNLMIHIIDTGIGISEEDMPHIFEKFYRSSDEQVRQKTGHGLGLSIAKQIVELHDGEIKVKSKKGEGSQFSITLPIEKGYFLD